MNELSEMHGMCIRVMQRKEEEKFSSETVDEGGKSWKFLKHIFAIIIRPIHVNTTRSELENLTASWKWKARENSYSHSFTICSRSFLHQLYYEYNTMTMNEVFVVAAGISLNFLHNDARSQVKSGEFSCCSPLHVQRTTGSELVRWNKYESFERNNCFKIFMN